MHGWWPFDFATPSLYGTANFIHQYTPTSRCAGKSCGFGEARAEVCMLVHSVCFGFFAPTTEAHPLLVYGSGSKVRTRHVAGEGKMEGRMKEGASVLPAKDERIPVGNGTPALYGSQTGKPVQDPHFG